MQFRRYIDIVKAVPPVAKEYIMRDSIILRDVSTQVVKGNVNLHWWRMPYGKTNVGDYLSCVIVEWMKKECGITSDSSYNGKTHHLYALGSIIDMVFRMQLFGEAVAFKITCFGGEKIESWIFVV